MSRRYPSQEYHPCRQHKQAPSREEGLDHQRLDQAIIHYRVAEHLQGQAAAYRQRVAWLEQEARQAEQRANQLVYQAGKGRTRAPEHRLPERQHRRERSRAEVAAAAAVEEAAVAEAVAVAAEARRAHRRRQEDKRRCKEPQLRVRFQLPMEP